MRPELLIHGLDMAAEGGRRAHHRRHAEPAARSGRTEHPFVRAETATRTDHHRRTERRLSETRLQKVPVARAFAVYTCSRRCVAQWTQNRKPAAKRRSAQSYGGDIAADNVSTQQRKPLGGTGPGLGHRDTAGRGPGRAARPAPAGHRDHRLPARRLPRPARPPHPTAPDRPSRPAGRARRPYRQHYRSQPPR